MRKSKAVAFVHVFLVVGVLTVAGMVSAEIPRMINYQGKVTELDGDPIADGIYTMRFQIYNQLVGGSPLWDSGNQAVIVTGGIFSINLGGTGQPEIDLEFDEDYWLLVSIEGDIQSPRRKLGSVGYAYMTSGLVPGTEISGEVSTEPFAALRATNTSTEGDLVGLYGASNSPGGGGVFGYGIAVSDETYGVYGLSLSTEGVGVYGWASATTGTTYGGKFESDGTSGIGVYGDASASSGSTYGLWGYVSSTDGTAVYGEAVATEGETTGILGESFSPDGIGVYGVCLDGEGVAYGVKGETFSTNGKGVAGFASNIGIGGTAYGVYGYCGANRGYAVYASGDFAVSGAKNCVVSTSKGPSLLYCQESPECWFEDFGEGQLVNGRCHIDLDLLFLETVTINEAHPMQVFVQPYHPGTSILVVERGRTGFDVYNPTDDSASGSFGYRVVAKRKGYEEKRLDYCRAGETDPHLGVE